jgi:putative transposase
VGNTRYTEDVKPLLQKGKELTGKRPLSFISDGARNFHQAYKKEFFTINNPRTKYIRHIRFKGDNNNNKMERMNGEVRDREKVTMGLKKVHSPLLKGIQIYHNYIREHDGLNGQTPAEKCGIKIEGKDKWMTIIQNAKKELKNE